MYSGEIIVVFIVFSLHFHTVTRAELDDSFRGAVVEYGPKYTSGSSRDSVLLNVDSYKTIVETLKTKYSDINIIVFPEGGLSINFGEIYAEEVPDPDRNEIPCENNSTEVLKKLSCIAKNNSVYLVINMAEKSRKNNTTYFYNTNVAFSRTGAVIARYRKFNIYGYEGRPFHKTEKPDISYFDTDFGVRFGTFTCFDIDFKSPALDLVYNYNVTHIAFPTGWISELPFLTAVQVQSGWAHATNTILLASGSNNPQTGSTGTGIYFGKLRYKESFENLSLQNQIKGDFAIISYIPKTLNATSYLAKSEIMYFYNTSKPEKVPLKLLKDFIHDYTTKAIIDSDEYEPISETYNLLIEGNTTVNETVCDRGLCCEFAFKMKKRYRLDIQIKEPDLNGDAFGHFKYRLAVFNGVRSYGGGIATGGVQVCSIISCLTDQVESCGERTDKGVSNTVTVSSGIKYKQFFTSFYDVTIKAKLAAHNNTFLASNILLASNDFLPEPNSENLRFGKTTDSGLFEISRIAEAENLTAVYLFESKGYINNPASINLYNRLFDLDGQNATTNANNDSTSTGWIYRIPMGLFVSFAFLLYIFN